MTRISRHLVCGCLSLFLPLLAMASGNSLLVPATRHCQLGMAPAHRLEALRHCQMEAGQGNLQAAYELGEYFYQGQYSPRDLKKALYWFEQASARGHAAAQHQLGLMYFRGEGVRPNTIQAYIVLKMAAVNGEEEALDTADLVAAQMRPEELEGARQVLGRIFHDYLDGLQAADLGP